MNIISSNLLDDNPERAIKLAEYDLDYTDLEDHFQNLLTLAAKVAGTPISMVNLVDSYSQWAVSSYGIEGGHLIREDSVCQYTAIGNRDFEVKDLSADLRFNQFESISGPPNLRYYFGTPIRSEDGYALGSLCVINLHRMDLAPQKIEILHLLAKEVADRLHEIKDRNELHAIVRKARELKKCLVHDIRGPLGGIIGLSDIILQQGSENSMAEVMEFMDIIHKSSSAVLELANEILASDRSDVSMLSTQNTFDPIILKEKLDKLYGPQAKSKGVNFSISTAPESDHIPFKRDKILQIVGNIISNAIKFTSAGGSVSVQIAVRPRDNRSCLSLVVSDTGTGIPTEQISNILEGIGSQSIPDTNGQTGYGLGLGIVKNLVGSLSGHLAISSELGKGTTFHLHIPID